MERREESTWQIVGAFGVVKGHRTTECKSTQPPPKDAPVRFELKRDGKPAHQFPVREEKRRKKARKSHYMKDISDSAWSVQDCEWERTVTVESKEFDLYDPFPDGDEEWYDPFANHEDYCMMNEQTEEQPQDHSYSQASDAESDSDGALRMKILIKVGSHGKQAEVTAAIDTFADWSIIHPRLAQPLTKKIFNALSDRSQTWVKRKSSELEEGVKTNANVCGGKATFDKLGAIRVYNAADKKWRWIPGFIAPTRSHLPATCPILVNPRAIKDLGFSVDKLMEDQLTEINSETDMQH